MGKAGIWWRASRPLALSNVLVPLGFGASLGGERCTVPDLAGLALWGTALTLHIVWSNDVADRDADRENPHPTIFGGGSRVLVEGRLQPPTLARAAVIAAAMAMVIAIARTASGGWWGLPALTVVGILLAWAYDFPPLRVSYRGGGEWLQALGIGVVLPMFAHTWVVGSLAGLPVEALVPAVVLGGAGNVLTALPDREGDERAGKRTLAVRLGAAVARRRCLQLHALAVLLTPLVVPDADRETWLAVELPPLAAIALAAIAARRLPPGARTPTWWVLTLALAALGAWSGWMLAR